MTFFESIFRNLDLYDCILIVTLILLSYFKVKRYNSLPYLFEFILVISLLEIVIQVIWRLNFRTNLFIYTIIIMLSEGYYFFVFFDYFKIKKWSTLITISFFVWLILSLFLYDFDMFNRTTINPIPYFFGLTLIVFIISKYAYNIIFIDEFKEIKRDAILYFSIGIILFYVSSFTHILFLNLLVTDIELDNRFSDLLTYTNVLLSLGYLGATLCSRK